MRIAKKVRGKKRWRGERQELEWGKKERTPQVSDVRTVFEWLPTCTLTRTTLSVTVNNGKLAIVLKRAA